ncbi:tyrosine-type recombinase/integrase [Tepidibacter mesophilus]|uniref:tyrosine-type recombinase/integrase n=1 Tax=Tepidibacter mesophilus TaxID=655607 RepID=UPI000C086E7F|nr:tyrosine-type recombinase/integrase [Tepidibacter mesophilus]
MNPANEKLLNRYKMLCKNKGLTTESIKAIHSDLTVLLRFLGDKNLNDVTNIDLEDFLQYCMEDRQNGQYAISRKFSTINMFFQTMIKKDYLNIKNPMDKIDKIKIHPRHRDPLTEKEMEQIFKYLEDENDIRGLALYSLFYSSGCRLTEIWQLNRNNLNFNNRQFKVIGKGQKERMCVFSEYAKQNILKYIESRKDNLEALFISRENNRLSKKSIQDSIKNIAKRAGITKNVHPHILRHSAGFRCRRAGVAIENIQLFLGHSDPGVTAQIYARGNLAEVQNIFDEVYS